MFVRFAFFRMVTHQTDEHGAEEHEDKGLQEGDEQFHKGDEDGKDAREQRDARRNSKIVGARPRHAAEHQKCCEQRVTTKHVGEEANAQSGRLDKQPEHFDHKDDRNNKKQSLGTGDQFVATAQVFEPSLEPEFAEAVHLNHHKHTERQHRIHRNVGSCGSAHDGKLRVLDPCSGDQLQVLHRNHADQIQRENEKEKREQEWRELVRVLFAHDWRQHFVSQIESDDFDQLSYSAARQESAVPKRFGASCNVSARIKPNGHEHNQAHKECDHLEREAVEWHLATNANGRIKDVTDWIVA